MTHDPFGKLKFKDRDESWAGVARFPLFATVGERPEPPEMTEDEVRQNLTDMTAALDAMKEQMRERFGDQIDKAFAEIDQATQDELKRIEDEPDGEPEPDAEDAAREALRAERRAKRAAKLAEGKFPFRVAAPDETDPTPAQVASFTFLRDNEQLVLDAVRAAVWESFQNAFNDEYWRQLSGVKPAASVEDLKDRFAVLRFDITREARGGFAHLVFHIDSDWQDEHGNLVVFSPDARTAQWTTWDGLYDLLDSDEPEEADRPLTSHEQLVDAVYAGEDEKARELIASGADINALEADEYPPLWVAVDQMEVELVRRLLAFGADPNLANADERTTPLKHAKRMYRDMGFAPSKNTDPMLASMMELMQQAAGPAMQEYKQRLEQIVALLEAAGGKV